MDMKIKSKWKILKKIENFEQKIENFRKKK